MPNFIAKSVQIPPFNYTKDGVKFGFVARSKFDTLIQVSVENVEFFIALKSRKNDIVLKGEKSTKPVYVSFLQRALNVLKSEFCTQILSDSTQIKSNKIIKSDMISDEISLLNRIKERKFERLFIEIGFGSGRHLLYQAKQNPQILIIGIEIYTPAIAQVCKLATMQNLNNILLLNADARAILEILQTASVDKIFMHFPVPWDKSEQRRVISSNFVKDVQRILKKDAKFELRSDDFEYLQFAISHFLALKNSKLEIYKDKNAPISSKYEDRWKKHNKNIFDMVFVNLNENCEKKLEFDMKFDEIYEPCEVAKNFKNTIIKTDECFLHLQSCYEIAKDDILLKLSFGAFYRPQNCFVRLRKEKCEYYPKKPLGLRANFAACKLLKEFLQNASNHN